jgi:electron transport complex protein RnfD
MLDVVIAMVPALAAAVYYFRLRALLLVFVCVMSSAAVEWLCNFIRKKPNSLEDYSAVVTGIILALSLPPHAPWWVAAIGGVFAITIGKMVFGGLGSNIFNPAMVARAFLTASFGVLMTTWTVPATIDATMPKISPDNKIDALTQATPLAWSKQALKEKANAQELDQYLKPAFTGNIGGCLGETSALWLLAGGLYMLYRRTITWHIPVAVLTSAFVFATVANIINGNAYASGLFHLTSGALVFCAFFIATCPVTSPLTPRGMLIFGAGVGAITMLIRIVGEYPEGVMYAVLLMNAFTPLIDRYCKLIPAGGEPNV